MMRSFKSVRYMCKMQSLTHTQANSVVIKKRPNLEHTIFNIRDTEVAIMYNIGSIKESR